MPDSLTDDILWLVCNRELRGLPRDRGRGARARRPLAAAAVCRRRAARRRRRQRARGAAVAGGPMTLTAVASRFNFDGIPGPTHNYSGLAQGNLASERNASQVAQSARGRAAGTRQDARARRSAAFRRRCCRRTSGRRCARCARSASAASDARRARARGARRAGAARRVLVGGGDVGRQRRDGERRRADTADGRVHFTPANLATHFHRALEAPTTTAVLRAIFADAARFVVHDRAAADAADRRRGRGQSHAPRSRGRRWRRLLRLRPPRPTAPGPSPRDFPRGRRSRRRRRSRAAHGLDPRRTRVRAAEPGAPSTPACSTTTSSPSATARRMFCHERAWLDQHAVLAELARRGRPRVRRRSSCAMPSVIARRRRGDLPLQQPAASRAPKAGCCSSRPPNAASIARVAAYLDRLLASGGPIARSR